MINTTLNSMMEVKQVQRNVLDSNKEEYLIDLWQQTRCLCDVSSSCYHDRAKKDVTQKV